MDPRSWVDTLYTYGPYAVSALFLLWVAPAQTKAFCSLARGDRPQQTLKAGIAITCWLVVLGMIGYITSFWPARRCILDHSAFTRRKGSSLSTTPELFIRSTVVPGKRLKWDYVIVTGKLTERDS